MTETPVAAPRATRREWIGLAVLALPTLLLSLDVSVLYLALPKLSSDLGATNTQQLWILDIYSFLLAGFLVTMGTLGDRIGRRKLLLIGGAAFGVASILAAYSSSPEMLIATRALLGIAGATLMPSTMALIRNMFHDPVQMGQAIGLWFSCFMGGMLLGPVVGGVLLEHFWWGSAFLLGVPVMMLLLIVGPRLLPEYRDSSAGRLDPLSVLLSLAAILPVVWGLKELARGGWALLPAATIATGVGIGIVFVRRQQRLEHPLLDLKLFRLPKFSAALGVMLIGGLVMAGISLQAALYLQVVEELSPLTAGLWMIPSNLMLILGLSLAPRLAQRLSTSFTMTLGLTISAAGMLLLTQTGSSDIGLLITGLAIASFGISFPMTLTMNLMLATAPPERAGSAASLSETSGEGGIALGVAILGSLGTLVYRQHLSANLPAELPTELADQARQSVTAAISTAATLPGQLASDLTTIAKAAFTNGLTAVAGVGAAAFLLCAAVSAVTLRERPTYRPSNEGQLDNLDKEGPKAAEPIGS